MNAPVSSHQRCAACTTPPNQPAPVQALGCMHPASKPAGCLPAHLVMTGTAEASLKVPSAYLMLLGTLVPVLHSHDNP